MVSPLMKSSTGQLATRASARRGTSSGAEAISQRVDQKAMTIAPASPAADRNAPSRTCARNQSSARCAKRQLDGECPIGASGAKHLHTSDAAAGEQYHQECSAKHRPQDRTRWPLQEGLDRRHDNTRSGTGDYRGRGAASECRELVGRATDPGVSAQSAEAVEHAQKAERPRHVLVRPVARMRAWLAPQAATAWRRAESRSQLA